MEDGTTCDADAAIPLSKVQCGEADELYILTLPEKGQRRRRKWCFGRQIEQLLYGSQHHSSNLW